MNNIVAGIDFSKEKFDIRVVDMRKNSKISEAQKNSIYSIFENNEAGYTKCMGWIRKSLGLRSCKDILFCGEDTGRYSIRMCYWMAGKELRIWIDSALRISKSLGIRRSKTDKADALAIADYAIRHQDQAVAFTLPDNTIVKLRNLLKEREVLVRQRDALKVRNKSLKETEDCLDGSTEIIAMNTTIIDQYQAGIKHCETLMKDVVNNNESLKKAFQNITSIKGVALINGIAFIAYTNNFRYFGGDYRKIATYWGVSPHEHTSGSSVRGKTQVSPMCFHTLKRYISEAAKSAVVHEPRFQEYFERLIKKGKNKNIALNNVKNKLIRVITVLAIKDEEYDNDYLQKKENKNVKQKTGEFDLAV